MQRRIHTEEIGCNPHEQLLTIGSESLMPLPDGKETNNGPAVKSLTTEQRDHYESSLDGIVTLRLLKPKTKEEENELIQSFLNGLRKLLSEENNWTFLQPLLLSLDYCAKCQTCSEACPIYLASGRQEIYRPTYRSEVLRQIKEKYLDKRGRVLSRLTGNLLELNWAAIARLAELSYRCTLCRRCAQVCPIGIDNGLITREIRKLFSQEMGIAPKELHESGTVRQLKVGASTGLTPHALKDIIQFMEEEIEEKTGKKIRIPLDREGADILLIHNSGEFMSWPENPEAFAVIFEAAGLSWTLSSDLGGYEATNYGAWYDDVQLARITYKQVEVARKLGVKKIVIGECGHAHKALTVTADRLLTREFNIPRESCMPLLEDIVLSGRNRVHLRRNDFLVTLHDPCNLVRLMGIVEPQRRILREISSRFREMEPHGVDNYCCGGGSGFAIMNSMNFPDWKTSVAGRMKIIQILDTFKDVLDRDIPKYVCTPCSNCKGQMRDLFEYYGLQERYNINYTGLAELIVNAMADMKERMSYAFPF
jgi:Fe-S oxidoreductase